MQSSHTLEQFRYGIDVSLIDEQIDCTHKRFVITTVDKGSNNFAITVFKIYICSVQKTYLRLLTIGLALARASAQLQDSNIPPTGRVAGGDTLSPCVL